MPDLLDLLSDSTTPAAQLRVVTDSRVITLEALWCACLERAKDLAARYEHGEAIAMLLATSVESLITLIGAWLAGLDVASLPFPAFDASSIEYEREVQAICRLLGPAALYAEELPSHLMGRKWLPPRLEPVLIEPSPMQHSPLRDRKPGRLIQFTSGTTDNPKGVVLTTQAIGASVAATLARLRPTSGDVSCSWLPLSHDMGLIGMCLCALVGAGPLWSKNGTVALIPPELFRRRPNIWLKTCAEVGATITASSTRGVEIATRLLAQRSSSRVDLSHVRCWIVGSEPIAPESLRRLEESARPFGLQPGALCPSYGLAEASLAVSLTSPERRWRTTAWQPPAGAGAMPPLEIVASGLPLSVVDVGIDHSADLGAGDLYLNGPSLFEGYLGKDQRGASSHRTGDLGFVEDEELFVIGRMNDIVDTAEGLIFAPSVESRLSVELQPTRRCAITPSDDGASYELVVELRASDRQDGDLTAIAERAAATAMATAGIAPRAVVFVPKGQIPFTHSGKLRRAELTERLRRAAMDTVVRRLSPLTGST